MNTLASHIAVCVDNSPASAAALDEAWRLREAVGCERFTLVHVIPSPMVVAGHGAMWLPDPTEIRTGAAEWMDTLAVDHPGSETVLLDGYPPAEVCDWAARSGVDMIVASSSRGLFDRVLLGSFAGYLTRHAPCSVLLTRPHPMAKSDGDPALAGAERGGK